MTIIVGDTHFHNDNDINREYLKFFNKYIISNSEYKNIILLGDIFNSKKMLNIKSINFVLDNIFDKLTDRNIYIVMGNHDYYNRVEDKESINSLRLLDRLYKNIKVIYKDNIIKIGDKDVYAIPYGFQPDSSKIDRCDYIIGHIELSPQYSNSPYTLDTFKNKPIYLGHYHLKTYRGIPYVGTPYHMNFNDIDEKKGFHILNDDYTLTFIENSVTRRYLSMIKENNKITIENRCMDYKDFLKNIDNYKHHIYYLYNRDSDEEFITLLDSHGFNYIVKTVEVSEMEIVMDMDDEDIFDIIEHILDRDFDRELLKEAKKELNSQ